MSSLINIEQGTMIQNMLEQYNDNFIGNSDIGANQLNVGLRLLEIRKQRKMTLQQASKLTGVSPSTFSKIERDELSPTISTMQRIASGLGIDLIALLSDHDQAQPYARRSVNRVESGHKMQTNTCLNKLLSTELRNKRMIPIMTTVTAKNTNEYKHWASSEAEIFVYVVAGELVVHSAAYEPLHLKTGESMYYDANVEHAWTSAGTTPATVLWLLSV